MTPTHPRRPGWRRLLAPVLAALALALLLPGAALANLNINVAKTMTRNLYLGADLTPAIASTSLEGFSEANGQILREVDRQRLPGPGQGPGAGDPRTEPDLVGLQEVALWRTADQRAAVPARRDAGQLRLSAGTARRAQQRLARVTTSSWSRKSSTSRRRRTTTACRRRAPARLPERRDARPADDARRDPRPAWRGVQTWNAEGGNFTTLLEVPILGQPKPIKRGWTETDAKVRGSHPFHFVNTHLEASAVDPRRASEELVAPGGPATSRLPVVLVGDLNSDDDTVAGADRLAYEALLAAGFVERSTDGPLSCCLEIERTGGWRRRQRHRLRPPGRSRDDRTTPATSPSKNPP